MGQCINVSGTVCPGFSSVLISMNNASMLMWMGQGVESSNSLLMSMVSSSVFTLIRQCVSTDGVMYLRRKKRISVEQCHSGNQTWSPH